MRPVKRDLVRLAALGAVALAARLAVVFALPDLATDSYGHMNIARALAHDPRSLSVHWVWLPGWHYLLAGLVALGGGHTAARVVVAVIAAAIPFMVYAWEAPRSREVAFVAAVACTLAPLTNAAATSAQPETAFALLVLGAAWALERARWEVAGALLLAASLIRYEAWGAVFAVAVAAATVWPRRALVAAVMPAAGIGGWIVLRHGADGRWLAFVGETHDFVAAYRAHVGASRFAPLVGLVLPLAACGPALPFAVLGTRRAWRPSFAVAAGIAGFLVVGLARGSALALPRYLTALTPFLAIAMAEGARRAPELARRIAPRTATTAMLMSVFVTTAAFALYAVAHGSM